MLDVDEPSAGLGQRINFLIDLTLADIGLMMDGKARHNRIKRTLGANSVYPSLIAIIEILKGELTCVIFELLACLFQHRLGEIHEHTMRRWIFAKNRRAQNAIAATQIEKVLNGLFSRFENRHHHAKLFLR